MPVIVRIEPNPRSRARLGWFLTPGFIGQPVLADTRSRALPLWVAPIVGGSVVADLTDFVCSPGSLTNERIQPPDRLTRGSTCGESSDKPLGNCSQSRRCRRPPWGHSGWAWPHRRPSLRLLTRS